MCQPTVSIPSLAPVSTCFQQHRAQNFHETSLQCWHLKSGVSFCTSRGIKGLIIDRCNNKHTMAIMPLKRSSLVLVRDNLTLPCDGQVNPCCVTLVWEYILAASINWNQWSLLHQSAPRSMHMSKMLQFTVSKIQITTAVAQDAQTSPPLHYNFSKPFLAVS